MWFLFVSLLLPHKRSKESLGQEKELKVTNSKEGIIEFWKNVLTLIYIY